MANIAEHEEQQIKQANSAGRPPVLFVHGLWLLPSSWDRWRTVFEDAGYTTLAPGWPDDPDTVEAAQRAPRSFRQEVGRADRRPLRDVVGELNEAPRSSGTPSVGC